MIADFFYWQFFNDSFLNFLGTQSFTYNWDKFLKISYFCAYIFHNLGCYTQGSRHKLMNELKPVADLLDLQIEIQRQMFFEQK